MSDSGLVARLLTLDGWVLLTYEMGPPLIRALLVALGTWIAVRLSRSSFNLASRRVDTHAHVLIGRVITIVIVGLGIATILDTVGVPLTTFVTVLGVAGLGISLAMQDILKSFVAGTYLLFERPFRIGDEISVKDQRGVVESIGVRTTLLRNADNVQIIIPNAVVFAEMVANRTNERKPEPDVVPMVDEAPAPPPGVVAVPVGPVAASINLAAAMPGSQPATATMAIPASPAPASTLPANSSAAPPAR